MKKFKLEIELGHEIFDEFPEIEVERLLRAVADEINTGLPTEGSGFLVQDSNNTVVGTVMVEEED